MTRTDEIRELFEYNRWANRRLLEAAERLDPEALRRDLGSSFPSILATLGHVVSADWIWLRRWSGESPRGLPPEWELGSLEAIRSRWSEVETERDAVLAALDDDALTRRVDYRNTAGAAYTGRMDQMLRHVVNHSTYHRGQIATMLRQVGSVPPATDLIVFHRERQAAGGAE